MKMDYFQVDWCPDVVLVALAFGAFAACQLAACSLDAVELAHQLLSQLSPKQLVMTVLMVMVESE
jgi:hypothetical protein